MLYVGTADCCCNCIVLDSPLALVSKAPRLSPVDFWAALKFFQVLDVAVIADCNDLRDVAALIVSKEISVDNWLLIFAMR